MYDLTAEDCKYLAEFLGECWHEWHRSAGFGDWICLKCKDEVMALKGHRTFSTPQDLHDLFNRLVEMGKWEEFYQYATRSYKESFVLIWKDVLEHEVSQWLFINPARFCWLMKEFLGRKG